MAEKAIREREVREVAADSAYTAEEIAAAAETVHKAVRTNLVKHYEKCFVEGGLNYHLYDIEDEAWFAMGEEMVHEDLRDYGADLDRSLVLSVLGAFERVFQGDGSTITIPRPIARRRKDPMFYPVRVRKSDEWLAGEQHVMQLLKAFTKRAEMTPSEALDYWATEWQSKQASWWAGQRRVSSEAVRKNTRKAVDKINENGLGDGYESNMLRVSDAEDRNDKDVYDEESERYYVPIDGTLERVD